MRIQFFFNSFFHGHFYESSCEHFSFGFGRDDFDCRRLPSQAEKLHDIGPDLRYMEPGRASM